MVEKKEYFWNEFNPKWGEVFQMELLEYKDKMDLLSFYSAMADLIRSKGVNIKEVEDDYIEKQTLSFLYPLLKNGELVMQSFELDLENKLKNGECEIKYMYIGNKETADKAIKILEDSWIKCNSQISKNLLEMETWFVLPENIHILKWQREEIWKYIEPIDEIGFRYKEKSKDKKNKTTC